MLCVICSVIFVSINDLMSVLYCKYTVPETLRTLQTLLSLSSPFVFH